MHTDENPGEEGAILQIFAKIPEGGGSILFGRNLKGYTILGFIVFL
jgi:hypothetical protein